MVLGLALGLPQTEGGPFEGLVAQLGASKYAEREEATRKLAELGREALAALRLARQAEDPEVSARANALIEKIETDLLVQPTMIRLDFQNQPVSAIVSAISERGGIPLKLLPDNEALWANRRVTLEAPEPQAFWAALDRLCAAAELRPGVGSGSSSRNLGVQLTSGEYTPSSPTSDNGPFRVIVSGIHYQRERVFGGLGGQPRSSRVMIVGPQGGSHLIPKDGFNSAQESFYIDLQVIAEPRIQIALAGTLNLEEVVDELSQDLRAPRNASTSSRVSTFLGSSSDSCMFQTQLPLKYPEKESRLIKSLKGTIPVSLSARKSEPLVIELAGAEGRTFETEGVAVTIHAVQARPMDQLASSIELSLRVTSPEVTGVVGGFPPMANNMLSWRGSALQAQSQIEIQDSEGRAYRTWVPTSTRIEQTGVRMTVSLPPQNEIGPPAKMLYYPLVRTQTNVAFHLKDVPMP